MHFGRVPAGPFVALDRAREPPFLVARGGEQRLPELGLGASESDPLEALAVLAAGEPTNVRRADNRHLDQANRANRYARARPSGTIRAGGVQCIAQCPG